ncbi:hypothetical protein F5X97DRAFT_295620 [Nemania serpens]|nr:hypothetical protein F5X97DRAFT_295620 [Nemania serpens]
MAKTQDKPAKEKKAAEKKVAEKKGTAKRVRKTPNPSQKRGQPTAAARVISSPYIKFGWHRPLSGETKEAVQRVSSIADSMYMLQIERQRPIESLSLRNGIFWEQRQLVDDEMISTPAIDHIDLFPREDDQFQDTLDKLGKQWVGGPWGYSLHYIFSKMRTREFLLLPVEIGGYWVTVIARMRQRPEATVLPADFDWESGSVEYADREVTDLAIVDPIQMERESRRDLIRGRLAPILAEGCIEMSTEVTVRDIVVPDIDDFPYLWRTGVVAYAISREFLRRLKTLQWRRDQGVTDSEFLWAPFEEHYNFDAYRQSLMSACAHQCIEMSGFQVRMALDVPSEDSNYHLRQLSHIKDDSFFKRDEKWEVFQSPTHTFYMSVGKPPGVDSPDFGPSLDDESQAQPESPQFSPFEEMELEQGQKILSLAPFGLDEEKGTSSLPIDLDYEDETASNLMEAESAGDSSVDIDSHEDQLSDAGTQRLSAPEAPMGEYDFSLSSQIPGLSLTPPTKQEDAAQETWRKRRLSEIEEEDEGEYDDDGEIELRPAKRLKV